MQMNDAFQLEFHAVIPRSRFSFALDGIRTNGHPVLDGLTP